MAGSGFQPVVSRDKFQPTQRTFLAPIRVQQQARTGGGIGGVIDNATKLATLGTTLANYFQGLGEKDRKTKADAVKSLLDTAVDIDYESPEAVEAFTKQAISQHGDEEWVRAALDLGREMPRSKEFRTGRATEGIHKEMEAIRYLLGAAPGTREEVTAPVSTEAPPTTEAPLAGAPPVEAVPATEVPLPEEVGITPPPVPEEVPLPPVTETTPPPVPPEVDIEDVEEPPFRYDDIEGSVGPGYIPLRSPSMQRPPTFNDMVMAQRNTPMEPNPNPNMEKLQEAFVHMQRALSYWIEEKVNLGKEITKEDMALISASDSEFKRAMSSILSEGFKVVRDDIEPFNTGHNRDIVITARLIEMGDEGTAEALKNMPAGDGTGRTRYDVVMNTYHNVIPDEIKRLYDPLARAYITARVNMADVWVKREHYRASEANRLQIASNRDQVQKDRNSVLEKDAQRRYNLSVQDYNLKVLKAQKEASKLLESDFLDALDGKRKALATYAAIEADEMTARDEVYKGFVELSKMPTQTPEGKIIANVFGKYNTFLQGWYKVAGKEADQDFYDMLSGLFSDEVTPEKYQEVSKKIAGNMPVLDQLFKQFQREANMLYATKGFRRDWTTGKFLRRGPDGKEYVMKPGEVEATATFVGPDGGSHTFNVFNLAEAKHLMVKSMGIDKAAHAKWDNNHLDYITHAWATENGGYSPTMYPQQEKANSILLRLTEEEFLRTNGPVSGDEFVKILVRAGVDPTVARTALDPYMMTVRRRLGKDAAQYILKIPPKETP